MVAFFIFSLHVDKLSLRFGRVSHPLAWLAHRAVPFLRFREGLALPHSGHPHSASWCRTVRRSCSTDGRSPNAKADRTTPMALAVTLASRSWGWIFACDPVSDGSPGGRRGYARRRDSCQFSCLSISV